MVEKKGCVQNEYNQPCFNWLSTLFLSKFFLMLLDWRWVSTWDTGTMRTLGFSDSVHYRQRAHYVFAQQLANYMKLQHSFETKNLYSQSTDKIETKNVTE